MEDDELTIGDILKMREEGALFAELEGDRKYALLLYEVYPNGTSSNSFIENPEIVGLIGAATGLGPATDPSGWGIWEVETVIKRKKP